MGEFNKTTLERNFTIFQNTTNNDRWTMPVIQGTTLVVLNSLLVPVGTIGNLLIIFAILNTPQLRRRVSNFLLLSLAVADLLVTTISQPLFVVSMSFITFASQCVPEIDQAYDISVYILCGSSLFHLAAISIDRAISILKPHRHLDIMSKKHLKVIISVCWVVAVVIVCFRIPFYKPVSLFGIFIFFGGYVLFICSYGAILYKVMQTTSASSRRTDTADSQAMSSTALVNRYMEKKVCEAVGIVTLIFSLCWLPLFIYLILTKGIPNQNDVEYFWIRTLYLSNSSVNFIVYSWRIDQFRVAYKKIINSILQRFGEMSGMYEPTTNISSKNRMESAAMDSTSKNNAQPASIVLSSGEEEKVHVKN